MFSWRFRKKLRIASIYTSVAFISESMEAYAKMSSASFVKVG